MFQYKVVLILKNGREVFRNANAPTATDARDIAMRDGLDMVPASEVLRREVINAAGFIYNFL